MVLFLHKKLKFRLTIGMLTQIFNGNILTPEGWVKSGSVLFDEGRIVEVMRRSNINEKVEQAIDAQGMNVVPGCIDYEGELTRELKKNLSADPKTE